jgi:hypothetical protein
MSPISTLRATGSCDVRQGAIVLGADPSLADLDGHLAVAYRAALAFLRNGADAAPEKTPKPRATKPQNDTVTAPMWINLSVA